MTITTSELDDLRAKWPEDVNNLPAEAQAVFAAWSRCSANDVKRALDGVEGFGRPPAPYQKAAKCRDLTLLCTPLPRSIRGVTPLAAPQVRAIGESSSGGGPPPGTSAEGSQDARLEALATTLKECQKTIATQNATIQQLFQAQMAEQDGDVQSSSYQVTEEVLDKLGKSEDGKSCSWMNILPLAKRDRNVVLREHCGTYDMYPLELDLLDATKSLKQVADAKITLRDFAAQEVSKFMMRNSNTIQMCGTVFSRVLEMRRDLEDVVTGDAEKDTVPLTDVIDFLEVLESACDGTLVMAIDTQTHMRLAVSRRIESALGVAYLRQDPFKKEKEDFIDPKTYTLWEEAATKKENLAWAMDAKSKVLGKGSSLFGNRSHNSSGGGKNKPFSKYTKGGRGRQGGSYKSPAPNTTPKPKGGKGGGKSGGGKGKKGD
jgi:hypothetical protein